MAISVGGLSTGLDVNGIVSQLMALERRPLNRLNSQQSESRAQLSAFGQLKSSLSSLEDAMKKLSSPEKFQLFSATSTNEDAFTAKIDGNASASAHQVTIANLATAHKLGSASFAEASTVVGTGTLHLGSGENSFDVAIDASNNTLQGIRDAINASTDNTSINASIINTGTDTHLVLSARETGLANSVSITATDDDGNNTDAAGLSNLIYGVGSGEKQAAQNASLTVDGYTVSSASNTVEGVIQGVTLNLKGETTQAETLNVTRDNDSIKENIQGFVDAYNSVRSTLRTLGGKDATLQGDNTLLSIERQLQNVLNDKFAGGVFEHLSDVGITSSATDGSLSVDSSKLDKALSEDFNAVANLFGDETNGYAVRFGALADTLSGTNGLISNREEGLNSKVREFDNRRDTIEYRLEQTEKRFRAQFTALETLVAQMQTSGDFLSRQLANLPTFGR